jgi:excisionase family DNA binding protein
VQPVQQSELPRLLYNKREVAHMIGQSLRTIDNLIVRKELPVRRIGSRVMIRRDDVVKFVKAA